MKTDLWVDAKGGISASSFAAALVGLGVDEKGLDGAVRTCAEQLEFGPVDMHTHLVFLEGDTVGRELHITRLAPCKPIPWAAMTASLDEVLAEIGVSGPYAAFVRHAVALVDMAQITIGTDCTPEEEKTFPVQEIGKAHTPYRDAAPRQPKAEDEEDDAFFIELAPEYTAGIKGLESFSQILVLSYLDRSQSYSITFHPSWKEGHEQYGVFATRSPNRPSPIGLTRTRLRRIVGSRIYTGPLDLYDGTPIVDIKPFFRSLDGVDEEAEANDGWLEGSDHLELHRLGIPHVHPAQAEDVFEPQTFLLTLLGIAWGLQQLAVDLEKVRCAAPLHTSSGKPCTGNILLEALAPTIIDTEEVPSDGKAGWGLGAGDAHAADHALRLFLK